MSGAHYMVSLGLRVFPVHGKRPLVKDWERNARADAEWLLKFPRATGYGMPMGDGLVGIDSDAAAGEQWASALPRTFTVRTFNGYHRIFRVPYETRNTEKSNERRLHEEVDSRGDGGYLIGPGSAHYDKHGQPTGATYEIAIDANFTRLPTRLDSFFREQAEDKINRHQARTSPQAAGSSAGRSARLVPVDHGDKRIPERTRKMLYNSDDGRDRRLVRVLFSLVNRGLTDAEIHYELAKAPLGQKVREMGYGYLEAKLRYARECVDLSPAERLTPGRWREKAAGIKGSAAFHKVIDAAALLAVQQDATHLSISTWKVAELAGVSRNTAHRNIVKLQREGWLRRTDQRKKAGRWAFSYLLTVPEQTATRQAGITDPGIDAFRHGAYGRWYQVYCALLASGGTVQELADRTGKHVDTIRRQLRQMAEAGLTEKEGTSWRLTGDAELLVQLLAVGTPHEGAGARQKAAHDRLRVEREANWANS